MIMMERMETLSDLSTLEKNCQGETSNPATVINRATKFISKPIKRKKKFSLITNAAIEGELAYSDRSFESHASHASANDKKGKPDLLTYDHKSKSSARRQ